MIYSIWAHKLTKQDIDDIANAGFQMIIATDWDNDTYQYAKEKGITLLRWIRDQEGLDNVLPYISKSDGFVLDPESHNKKYYDSLPNELLDKIVGTATWAIPIPIFKTLATKMINSYYGIHIEDVYYPWTAVKIYDTELPYLQYFFPMVYPFTSFWADRRVKWMLDGWAGIKEEYSEYKVIPILQAFSRALLDEGEDVWHPSKKQLKNWMSYVTRKGFDGVSFFCWETYKNLYNSPNFLPRYKT